MPEVAEWRFTKGGWIQVLEDADRAGHSSVTLVEENLDKRLSDLQAKAIEVQSTSEAESVIPRSSRTPTAISSFSHRPTTAGSRVRRDLDQPVLSEPVNTRRTRCVYR
jgi:hypothetical protein